MYNYHPLSKEEPEIRVYEHIFEKSLKGIFTDRVDTASVLKLNDFEVIGFWLKWLFRFFSIHDLVKLSRIQTLK